MPATLLVHGLPSEANGSNMSERPLDIVRSHDLPKDAAGPAREVGMAWLVVIMLVVAVPLGLLVWTRRTGGAGKAGTDPLANRDLGREAGPPSRPEGGDWGGAGGL
jgi:hypothetical protein